MMNFIIEKAEVSKKFVKQNNPKSLNEKNCGSDYKEVNNKKLTMAVQKRALEK
jgi:hypothetical protein